MSAYRLYCLDGLGKFCEAQWLTATDDDRAVLEARIFKPAFLKCEVWQGSRLVATLDATELLKDEGGEGHSLGVSTSPRSAHPGG